MRLGGVHALPPGVDFAMQLVAGLRARLHDAPPEAMAEIVLIVNTPLLRSRVIEAFGQSASACLLPRILTPSELADSLLAGVMPLAGSDLRRKLELAQLIAGLLAADPRLAPHRRLPDLADSLSALLDELHAENIAPATLAALDVADHAAHWARMQAFLGLVGDYLATGGPPDAEARLSATVRHLGALWQATPPTGPVIMAGSTGSRGNVARLMVEVARLPQGVLVLPGFDFDVPTHAWQALEDTSVAEDHPQGRFSQLMSALGIDPSTVGRWTKDDPSDPARGALISLALRPAPVTDQWRAEGTGLGDPAAATARMSLIEAPHPRAEALAIALRLRAAAQDGKRAALVTPDRTLARQVSAALDRWRIIPDDSAGVPLNQTAPGRLLRLLATMRAKRVTLGALLSLLKHPLVQAGAGRGAHLRLARRLELHLRRRGPAFPDTDALAHWAAAADEATAPAWAAWLGQVLGALGNHPAQDTLGAHVAAVQSVADLTAGADGMMWQGDAGAACAAVMADLAKEAPHGWVMRAADFADLLGSLLAGRSVRADVRAHPHIAIWGTREARVQRADLVILGGLVEGVWPDPPPADPWLSRPMRQAAGLVLPERRVGLAAHDFQQAIAAPEVVLSRSLRNAEAETVPSRWLNRLTYLLRGLHATGGPAALDAMAQRGAYWLQMAAQLEAPSTDIARAPRPAPCPPRSARPARLSVTEIQKLIRDPYSIYARHVLRLRPLDPLHPTADARMRGTILHRITERWLRAKPLGGEAEATAAARLVSIATDILAQDVPWPTARVLWQARIAKAAPWLAAFEATRPDPPVVLETRAVWQVPGTGVSLTGQPDRIDWLPDGRLHLIDYKSGSLPSAKEVLAFDKQLPLLALMAEEGCFDPPGPANVGLASYIGLSATPEQRDIDIDPTILSEVRAGLVQLLAHYGTPEAGYSARVAPRSDRDRGDYDQLARLGEWDPSDPPLIIPVGDPSQ